MSKVITAANQKGGVGKSTLIVNLAVSASQKTGSVCILDADPQKSIVDWVKVRIKAGSPHIPVFTPTSIVSDIAELKKEFDYVFVDTPGSDADGNMRSALSCSDLVLIPIEPSSFSVNRLAQMLEYVKTHSAGLNHILMSRVLPNPKRSNWDDLRSAINDSKELSPLCPVCSTVIFQRVAYADAAEKGLGVAEYAPDSLAALEINWLLDEKIWNL